MFCCSTPSSMHYERIATSSVQKTPTCCGIKASLCLCISNKTLFVIATVVGTILLTFGLLSLGGYFAPESGGNFVIFLQKIKFAATFVATKIGSDLFTLSILTFSFGAAFTVTGIVGLYVEGSYPKVSQQNDDQMTEQ